jgi:hypothetical protein
MSQKWMGRRLIEQLEKIAFREHYKRFEKGGPVSRGWFSLRRI